MEDYITRREHDEFVRRIEDEEHRQNVRLNNLENQTQTIQSLALSVDRLATSMDRMAQEQAEQGERLKALEQEPADNWRNVKKTVWTTIASVLAGALATGAIIMVAQYLK